MSAEEFARMSAQAEADATDLRARPPDLLASIAFARRDTARPIARAVWFCRKTFARSWA